MILGEELLWQAVIMRALQDALWVDPGKGAARRDDRVAFCGHSVGWKTANRLRDSAAFWLLFDKKDFTFVCESAGMSPRQVREGARMMLGASDDQKAIWSANGFSLSSVRALRESRDRRLSSERHTR